VPAYNPDAHKIGDVADQTGLSIRTLRHYEDCGLVTPPTTHPAASGFTPTTTLPASNKYSA